MFSNNKAVLCSRSNNCRDHEISTTMLACDLPAALIRLRHPLLSELMLKPVENLVLIPEPIRFYRARMLKFVAREHPGPASFITVQVVILQSSLGTEILQYVEREATLFVVPGGRAVSIVNPSSSLEECSLRTLR